MAVGAAKTSDDEPTHTFYSHYPDLDCTTPIFTSRITILTAPPTSDTHLGESRLYTLVYPRVLLSTSNQSHHHNPPGVAFFFFSGTKKYGESDRIVCELGLSCIALRRGRKWDNMGVFGFFCTQTQRDTLSEGIWMHGLLLLLRWVECSRGETTSIASAPKSSPVWPALDWVRSGQVRSRAGLALGNCRGMCWCRGKAEDDRYMITSRNRNGLTALTRFTLI